jgi:hypothetical protein
MCIKPTGRGGPVLHPMRGGLSSHRRRYSGRYKWGDMRGYMNYVALTCVFILMCAFSPVSLHVFSSLSTCLLNPLYLYYYVYSFLFIYTVMCI